jgi:lysophospholipase L1-like esterase
MRLACLLCFLASMSFAQTGWDTLPNLPDHYRKRVALFKKQAVLPGRVLMVGNSITEAGNWLKLLADSAIVNRGISGDVTHGLLARADEIVRWKPDKLFLLIGINDLSRGVPEEVILQNILSFVRLVQARSGATKIFVQSLLPVNPGFKNFPSGFDKNEAIVTINGQLQKVAPRFGFQFVDLHAPLADQGGLLDARFSYDGLHLNQAGYQRWAKVLKDEKHL